MVYSSNPPVINGICVTSKSWAQHHCSFKYLNSDQLLLSKCSNSATPNLTSIITYCVRNCIACKRFAVQTPLWPLKFMLHQNLEHNNITVSNLAWSSYISTHISYYCCKVANLGTPNLPNLLELMEWWVRWLHVKRLQFKPSCGHSNLWSTKISSITPL